MSALDLGPLFDADPWVRVRRCDRRARELADRHYSRQTPGAAEFMASGRTLVLLRRAGWTVVDERRGLVVLQAPPEAG